MKKIYLGKTPARFSEEKVEGSEVVLNGETFYRIAHSDRLRPFFLSIISSGDHWMFISSNGALTAGRQNPDLALFPYDTDDKIHDTAGHTGPKTIFLVERGQAKFLWEPFAERGRNVYLTQRNLYKSFCGNQIVFEEINQDLGLNFRYGWANSERFGWVRRCTITSQSELKVRMLDGLQNLLPCGVGSQFQLEKSTLIDAYKKNELLEDSGLGLFLLSSIPVDRPMPAESLRATTVWSAGISRRAILLSAVQLEKFRRDQPLQTETDILAERGCYFIESEFLLAKGESRQWLMAAEVNQGPVQVAALRRQLRSPQRLLQAVAADIKQGTAELWRLVAQADGLQKSARSMGDARHFSNVLFNIMRGGIFADGYVVDPADLLRFVRQANPAVAARHQKFFQKLGKTVLRSALLKSAQAEGDRNLERVCQEYLPLTFSRRHGDPSRPWNRFSIAPRSAEGRRVLNYEGNWRDIFQNWEALAVSFPGFVSGMICKFVNASTADGYNPYRVTRAGFDWEVHDPHDPWSHIGYWGDHQIIYLLKLLKILQSHEPEVLADLLTREIFSFANVPYRIRPYAQLRQNSRETVDFDAALDQITRERVSSTGADGKLLWNKKGEVLHVNLTEKLLIPILAKLANFIPGGGIWLNTQRPEWNDANNALVGNGLSLVTIYQLRRHLAFCRELFTDLEMGCVQLSQETADWLRATIQLLKQIPLIDNGDEWRERALDGLGRAGEQFRRKIYADGFSEVKVSMAKADLLEFCDEALRAMDETIRQNRRADGLYHSYNLADFSKVGKIGLQRLPEMLEGQAAVLSANFLSAAPSLALLQQLRRSSMYRPDQNSYLLYPNRLLPRFTEKNNLPSNVIQKSALLKKLLADGDRRLIERDEFGVCHFNPGITNAQDLQAVLTQLAGDSWAKFVKRDSALVLDVFEKMFDHRSFTGRSGTFFGYEGLGCIYWHMVSKLLLAAQGSVHRAMSSGENQSVISQLGECYHSIRMGLGDYKTPENYGAFPFDPYSHTPAQTGARQPGLTGQVKEDILCRFGELGVMVQEGRIHFQPRLLRQEEFLTAPDVFNYLDAVGVKKKISLPTGSLAFTYCQVPVVYELNQKPSLIMEFANGEKRSQDYLSVEKKFSLSIFARDRSVRRITCKLDYKPI